MTIRRFWLMGALGACALCGVGACGDDSGVATEKVCDDGVDNDGDGLTDCYDDDCIGSPTCDATSEINCSDNMDNDRDGDVDCDDADCATDPACVESVCDDLQDNDHDGLVDCDDPDCAGAAACAPETETICDDGVDNDLDGDTDCDDSDCAGDAACVPTTEVNCTDNLDDDLDGLVDCQDSDCAGNAACDGSGDTCAAVLGCVQGCADLNCINACSAAGCPSAQAAWNLLFGCTTNNCFSQCLSGTGSAACVACMSQFCSAEVASCTANTCMAYGETDCTDGVDNDSDGGADCADTDCAGEPVCGGTADTCGEALTCAQLCGSDVSCVSDCRMAACQTGQTAYNAVLGCMTTYCVDECLLNPGGGSCQQCLAANCAAEVTACLDDTCQVGGETQCNDGVDNDNDGDTDCADTDCQASPSCSAMTEIDCTDTIDNDNDGDVDCADAECATHAACSGPGWTCGEILVCTESCGTDTTCLNGCRGSGCASAQAVAAQVTNCLFASCLTDCATDPQGAACQTCMATNCQTELSDCASNTCP